MDGGGEAAVPKPSIFETFKWADGCEVGGDYAWMTDIDSFEEEIDYSEEPREVLVERWERTHVEVRTLYPPLYSCGADLDCDEDAVAWEQDGEHWRQVCENHRQPLPASPSPRGEEGKGT